MRESVLLSNANTWNYMVENSCGLVLVRFSLNVMAQNRQRTLIVPY